MITDMKHERSTVFARSIAALLLVATSLTACVSSSVQRVGSANYAPAPATADVAVFTAESQVKEPFEVVGVISYDNPGKYQVLNLGDAIEPLKQKAREVGANGIIIDNSQPVKSGIISTGIYVEARAVRLAMGSPTVTLPSSQAVAMQKHGGTFVVPVMINNAITLDFVVDSGATDVSIPADVVLTLVRTGTLTEKDFIGTQTYTLADGSTTPSSTFRIRSLKVGDAVVENVTGHVADVRGPLLLGQAFLGQFKSWSIDNAKHALVLE